MMKRGLIWLLGAGCLVLAGLVHGKEAPLRTATLVYTGNLDGELEPCGCSAEGDMGGIRRQSTMIERLRAQKPNLFVVSSGGLLTSETPRDRLKSAYILQGIQTQGYDAIGVQWRDTSYGTDFLQSAPLPWVSSNWTHDESFAPQRTVTRGGVTVSVFSWLDPGSSPFTQMAGLHQGVSADTAPLARALSEARQSGALTVLATTLPWKKARQSLPLADVDLLIVGSAYEKYGKPLRQGRTLVLQPGSRGMRLGRVDLRLDARGGIQSWKHAVIPLPTSVPDAPQLKAWYDEYNAKVKEAYLAGVELKKNIEAGKSPYAGAESCQSCHEQAYQTWQGSKHAHAFERLQEVGKAFDPDCITCHTVGFDKPGGYVDSHLTPALANVQCESCHGAARAHVDAGGATPVANAGWPREKVCGQCHIPAHSPAFRIDQYWPRIKHGRQNGGAAPAAAK